MASTDLSSKNEMHLSYASPLVKMCAKVGRENKKDVYNTGRRYFTSFKQYKAQASQRPAKQAYITLSSALSQRIHGGKG